LPPSGDRSKAVIVIVIGRLLGRSIGLRVRRGPRSSHLLDRPADINREGARRRCADQQGVAQLLHPGAIAIGAVEPVAAAPVARL
jgi:hypothetical protein